MPIKSYTFVIFCFNPSKSFFPPFAGFSWGQEKWNV